jgi:exopolysaccharide biosynthesis protein
MRNKAGRELSKMSVIAGFLAVLQVLTIIPVQALGTADVSSSVMQPLINETTTDVAPDIQEKRITYKNSDGFRTECFCVDVNLKNKNTSLYAGTPDDGSTYKLQTVRDQANAAIKNGKNVVAAVNGDYYNMATGEPQGTEIKNGIEIHKNVCNEPFFGIKNDGTPIIGDANTYQQIKASLKEAIGGPRILVKDGTPVIYNDSLYPCAAVGVRADNSAFFLVVDGAQYPYSEGITLADLAKMLADMGAKQALMLDGGGSATCVARTPGDSGLTCKNSPSDSWERSVGNSILIVSNVKPDGKFASAYLTPQDKTYTPKSTVQMKATGLDASGAAASLPAAGLTWSLSDPSFGTIDNNGLLTSNGKTGQVQVNLNCQGKTVGKTNIEFAMPDDIHFQSDSLSLDVNAEKSLGLVTRYQGRDVVLNQSDIKWDIPSGLGTVDHDYVFHTGNKAASGTATATLNGTTLTAKINLTVGQAPVVIYNFENSNDYGGWYTHEDVQRGQTASMGFSTYPSEPARFGNHALKLNFDYTTGSPSSTLNVYAGPPDKSTDIPGTPTAIGMWIYATPEAKGEWPWIGVYDSNGHNAIKGGGYLTSQQTGIDWTGWKYVEAPIKSDAVAPFHIAHGDAIGLFCVKSGQPNGCPMTKGSIYVDNIRAVYGTNNDDLTSPIIGSVTTDGKTYTKSKVDISAYVHDDMTDSNATGMNWDRSKIIVDGKDYSADKLHFSYDKDGILNLKGLNWPDGVHKITVDIQDNFGNETAKDSYFTVNSGSGTKVALTSGTESATLGGNYQINLTANDASDIKGVTAKIKVTKDFPVSVSFDPSVKGSSYDYDKDTGIVTLNIGVPSGSSPKGTTNLATISANIPKNTKSGSKLDYDVESSSVEYNSAKGDNYAATFSSKPVSVPITAAYSIKLQNSIVGKNGSLLVTDQAGKPVPDADVTMTKNDGSTTDLGKTGSDGTLTSSTLTASVQKFTLQAGKDGQYSFLQSTQSYNPVTDKVPSNILSGSTSDPKTEKSITWMSNPSTSEAETVMEYAPSLEYKANGVKSFQNATGSSQVLYYNTDSSAVRENSVLATGLKPGTEYSYRVGDGTNWSGIQTFTTSADTNKFTFNVFGDTQSADAGGLNDLSSIFTRIENLQQQPLFSIHVGDFVDDEQVFSEINTTAAMFDQHQKFNSIDMIHVLGNHEYQGDDGTKGALIYGVPQNGPSVNKQSCYSMNYGNMHISVIGWTDNESAMTSELEWLRHDVKSNNETWYIVATHQPAYNKNPDDPNTMFNKMLTPVCDELGINFVFNGHDHSYGRTYSLINGKKADNGTVYVSAGHTAEKTYNISPADPSVYAYVQQNKDDKFYITGTVDGNQLTIQAQTADGKVQDTYKAKAKTRADKTALEAAVSSTATYQQGDYTVDSWKTFQNALNAARKSYNDVSTSQADVDTAVKDLNPAITNLKLIDTGVSDIVNHLGDKPSKDEVAGAVNRIKGHLTAATAASGTTSTALTTLDTLLQNAYNIPAPSIPVPTADPSITGSAKMPATPPTVPGLLVASGVTGNETKTPTVTLKTTQKATSDILSFDLDLTVNGNLVHDLSIPITVTFQFPASFNYYSNYTYTVNHIKDKSVGGGSESLPLKITGQKGAYTGTFTTNSFSDFTVVGTAPSSPSNPSNPSNPSTPVTPVTPTNPTIPVTFVSDTTANFDVNGAYTFKITSKGGKVPTFVVGTANVFDTQLVKQNGNDYYFKITAVGAPGAKAGIYVNGTTRLLVATVKSNPSYVKSDTTSPFSVKVGKSYVFKLTADAKPTFVAGTGAAFRVDFVKWSGKDYFFRVTAVGKAGHSCGFYINREKTPVAKATISK